MQPDEERRILAVCDPQDRALIVLGMDTLIRQGDLLDITRDDVTGVWLYIANPKSGDPYEVPLSKRAVKALKAIDHDHAHYFEKFRRATNPRDWRGSVRQRLEVLCKAAGVPFGKAERGITFHWATRRTGATRLLVKKRQPVPVVQQLGNWKKPDVLLEIYTEADRGDMLKAVGQPLPNRSRSKRKSA
jgi:integrase